MDQLNQGGHTLNHIIETRNDSVLKKILRGADSYNVVYIEIVRYGSLFLDRLLNEGWIKGVLLFLKYYNINFDYQIKSRCLLHKIASIIPSDDEEVSALGKSIKLMLSKGWTVADIDPQGQTSLVTAFKSENHIAFAALVERESFENNKEIVDKIIVPVLISLKDEYATHLSRKLGISIKLKKEKELGFTALFKAFEHKLTIDLKNQIFWSSVTKGNKDVLQFMIEQCGMDVEMGDANERTVIEVAAQNGHANCVLYIFQKLLELKRSISKFGMYTILQLMLKFCPTENEKILSYQKTIQLILQHVPELVTLTDAHGTTLLHIACAHANFSAIQALCASKASFGTKDKNGDHPLHILSRFTNPKVIEIFRWLVLNNYLQGVIHENIKSSGTMRSSQILRMMREMKGKSNNWEHSDLQQTFWKGVVDYLNLSDALILQHVSSFFRLLIRTDTWTDILNKHGRMASKDQRLLQDTLEVLTNVLKFRSQQVLRDRYNLKDIPVVTTRVIEGVIVTSNQRTGVKFGSFFSKLFGTPTTSEIDGQIYSTFVGYLKGGEIQGIKLKLTIIQYDEQLKLSDKR
jgi:hypothetical protein